MTSFDDETLMAYADGELDPGQRAQVDAAMREDPQIGARVAWHRSLRTRISDAYAPELGDAVPEPLLNQVLGKSAPSALDPTGQASVYSIDAARQSRGSRRRDRQHRAWSARWRVPGALAASVLFGVGIGYLAWHVSSVVIINRDGTLVARGTLAEILSNRVAENSEKPSIDGSRINLSYRTKDGHYCRAFSAGDAEPRVGLACRRGDNWRIEALAALPHGVPSAGGFRTAASSLPPAIVDAIQEQIDGETLDRDAEAAARSQGWRTNP